MVHFYEFGHRLVANSLKCRTAGHTDTRRNGSQRVDNLYARPQTPQNKVPPRKPERPFGSSLTPVCDHLVANSVKCRTNEMRTSWEVGSKSQKTYQTRCFSRFSRFVWKHYKTKGKETFWTKMDAGPVNPIERDCCPRRHKRTRMLRRIRQ